MSSSSCSESDKDSNSSEESSSEEDIKEEPLENQIESGDDEVVISIKKELNKKREHPPDLKFDESILKLSFHPESNFLAVADILGDIYLCKYSNSESKIISTWEVHTDSCRDIKFNDSGDILYSVSKDQSLVATDVNTGNFIRFYENAHDEPINSLYVYDDKLIVTGDDSGQIKFWDVKSQSTEPIYKLKKHEDYISDMLSDKNKKMLICSSGDGSISTIDMNKREHFMQSENYDEEFTSIGLYRQDTKLVVTTTKDNLIIFNFNEFGYHSDIFPGQKNQNINGSVAITDKIMICATEEGILRATHLFPHRHIGIVGQHLDKMPIESVDINYDGKLIASCSHNQDVKFWNVKYFETFHLDDEDKPKKVNKKEKQNLRNNLPSSKLLNRSDFFSDLTK